MPLLAKVALETYKADVCPGDSANGLCLRYWVETPGGEVFRFDKRLDLDALVAKNGWGLVAGQVKIPAKIYIGVLSKNITDADLIDFWNANGAVVIDSHVILDTFNGKSRRFGLAKAADPVDVIVKCGGKLLNGVPVIVRQI